jgi:hypothetical protein
VVLGRLWKISCANSKLLLSRLSRGCLNLRVASKNSGSAQEILGQSPDHLVCDRIGADCKTPTRRQGSEESMLGKELQQYGRD